MKKLLVWLFVFILFSSFYITQAAADEYVFQGIPWLSSPEDVSKKLKEASFADNAISSIFLKGLKKGEGTEWESSIGQDTKNKKVPYTFSSKKNAPVTTKLQMATIFPSDIKATIADQTISWVFLCFTREPDNPQFVECRISFDENKKDKKALYKALVNAYGKPTSVKNNKINIWLGDNNTIIIQTNTEVVFATLDGLSLAESIEIPKQQKKNTGF